MSDSEYIVIGVVQSMCSLASCMLCAGTPTLQPLLKALKKLENWFLFGAIMGVPVSQLRKIESLHQKEADRCKLDMFQYWLDNNLVPTWNEVILALEETDQLVLAALIKQDFLLQTKEEGMYVFVLCTFARNLSLYYTYS